MSGAVVIPSLLRIHRQLRILDQAYMGAEAKKQVQSAVEAKLHDLRAIHDLLPRDVRDKSWILLMRWYGPWGEISKPENG